MLNKISASSVITFFIVLLGLCELLALGSMVTGVKLPSFGYLWIIWWNFGIHLTFLALLVAKIIIGPTSYAVWDYDILEKLTGKILTQLTHKSLEELKNEGFEELLEKGNNYLFVWEIQSERLKQKVIELEHIPASRLKKPCVMDKMIFRIKNGFIGETLPLLFFSCIPIVIFAPILFQSIFHAKNIDVSKQCSALKAKGYSSLELNDEGLKSLGFNLPPDTVTLSLTCNSLAPYISTSTSLSPEMIRMIRSKGYSTYSQLFNTAIEKVTAPSTDASEDRI